MHSKCFVYKTRVKKRSFFSKLKPVIMYYWYCLTRKKVNHETI